MISTHVARTGARWLLLGMALIACSDSHAPVQQFGGETNWLKACVDQGDCAHGECLAGMCTIECESSTDCHGHFSGVCRDPQDLLGNGAYVDAGARRSASLCFPSCEDAAACGADAECTDSACVPIIPGRDVCTCDGALASLECVCAVGTCPSLEKAMADVSCDSALAQKTVTRGCEVTIVTTRTGLSASTYAYGGADNQLVAASIDHDASFGACQTFKYETSIPYPYSCTDYQICDFCAGGENPPCDAAILTLPPCGCRQPNSLSLDCVCDVAQACQSYEDAIAGVRCPSPGTNDTQQLVTTGCGYTLVTLGDGYAGRSYLYQGTDHTIVGASGYSDTEVAPCQTVGYSTSTIEIPDCTELTSCELCGNGSEYPKCDL